jgi:hypothetical protein
MPFIPPLCLPFSVDFSDSTTTYYSDEENQKRRMNTGGLGKTPPTPTAMSATVRTPSIIIQPGVIYGAVKNTHIIDGLEEKMVKIGVVRIG